jgi:predicted glycosyltransferase
MSCPPSLTHAARIRVVLYSHDTMGLGHMRRNLLIAQALSRPPLRAVVLLIAGSRRATAFSLPRSTDCLTLPSLQKEPDSTYRPRRLAVELQELIQLRAGAIRSAVTSFEPDLLIVDNVPRGAVRELDPTLEEIRERGRTRCVLGLRDVLDAPARVQRDWTKAANEDAIRSFYDAIWVYGDRAVYDLAREYGFAPDIAARVRYTGYLDPRARLKLVRNNGGDNASRLLRLPHDRFALCLVGGGQDGANLAEAFAHADLPPGLDGVIVTGPFMEEALQARLQGLAAGRPRLSVVEFVREPMQLAARAERLVAMGGYNTTCEAVSLGKRTLIVPRVVPRTEQLIRATNFQARGLVEVLRPDSLSSRALSSWLASDDIRLPAAADRIDFNGFSRIPELVEEMLSPVVPSIPHRELWTEGHSHA